MLSQPAWDTAQADIDVVLWVLLQDTYDRRVFLAWRPDLDLVKYTVLQEVPDSEPITPPVTGTPTTGGVIQPLPDK